MSGKLLYLYCYILFHLYPFVVAPQDSVSPLSDYLTEGLFLTKLPVAETVGSQYMPGLNKENAQQLKELIQLNDDLENYFRNTIIPQLFVDANLILRKFTPPAMKQFRFSPEHIGRPMEELVDNIRFSTILDNIQEVIDTGQILEKEIQTTDLR
jgi:hypothetical protein